MATGVNSTVGKPSQQPAGGNHAVAKRLQSELMGLMMTPEAGVSAFPESDMLFRWVGTIEGPVNSVYEGLSYKLCLEFPPDYPYKPPKVTFTTACYHPNVDSSGRICLDILRDQWSALLDVRTILISIRSLLSEPNISSPMNVQAADLWSNQEQYRKTLLEKYEREVRMAAKTAK
ncbi:probable ubiquitin-conjugating enzyme E2 C [Varroa jacobsoni]|uniref:UBC core domain-containing protein n=1 Tax=Varroa destructor TaxID=109461 RepID=A0A7M7M3T2_VARDE|nr:probable ubiquitin-conjugating enzyme E2 C [Varroa destructor]XP_022705115.1 probable ubiquitin-conjugating enzyme E2 C [Varroa jacobsoni]XP_022705116.1 probable ubiquitin-conjugating enzyme E2 C [Varroa jacobsoni]